MDSTLIIQNTAISFHKWMMEHDTVENADEWFHFSDIDMYNAFLKHSKL